jgi:hypothetical protein
MTPLHRAARARVDKILADEPLDVRDNAYRALITIIGFNAEPILGRAHKAASMNMEPEDPHYISQFSAISAHARLKIEDGLQDIILTLLAASQDLSRKDIASAPRSDNLEYAWTGAAHTVIRSHLMIRGNK